MRKLNNNIRISSGRHGVNLHNDKQNFANVNPMKQWKLLSILVNNKRDPLIKEQKQLEEETHNTYLKSLTSLNECYEREMERIRMSEQHETARIEATYNQQIEALENERLRRFNELKESLLHELEESRRQIDGDIAALDISRKDGGFNNNINWGNSTSFLNAQNNQWSGIQNNQGLTGKKQLRRRPNEMSSGSTFAGNSTTSANNLVSASTDCNNSGAPIEKKGRKRSPGANQSCPLIAQTLLPSQAIAEDVEKYCSPTNMDSHHPSSSSFSLRSVNASRLINASNNSDIANLVGSSDYDEEERDGHQQRPSKVHLEPGRLSYDGKTFLRGQIVFVDSTNTGWSMQAMVMQITALTVQFRSKIPGDTRTVIATKEDLESRRVVVRKRH